MSNLSRRNLLQASAALSMMLAGCRNRAATLRAKSSARVVIVGGGFAGASCATTLQQLDPSLKVTLIEPKRTYYACPLSNLVLAGERQLSVQRFGYQALAERGIQVVHSAAKDIDWEQQRIVVEAGQGFDYDRMVMAPGIDMHYAALPGYSAQAAEIMPHAWQAGAQTQLLQQQLQGLPNNGLVVMAIPGNPYRCPPGPYERASLIAHFLTQHKPRAKLLLLDSKDRFSKQSLFQQAWQKHYPGLLEWQGASDGAGVIRVDANSKTLHTDFDAVRADVANVIPPQRAASIARQTGLTDQSGWCPIKPSTFASTLAPNAHVIGDAAIANAMPKSAFAANTQARLCAMQIVRSLTGQEPLSSKLLNTCYSMITPAEAISVAGVYNPGDKYWNNVPGAGGSSPLNAPAEQRRAEANYALGWFDSLTQSLFSQ